MSKKEINNIIKTSLNAKIKSNSELNIYVGSNVFIGVKKLNKKNKKVKSTGTPKVKATGTPKVKATGSSKAPVKGSITPAVPHSISSTESIPTTGLTIKTPKTNKKTIKTPKTNKKTIKTKKEVNLLKKYKSILSNLKNAKSTAKEINDNSIVSEISPIISLVKEKIDNEKKVLTQKIQLPNEKSTAIKEIRIVESPTSIKEVQNPTLKNEVQDPTLKNEVQDPTSIKEVQDPTLKNEVNNTSKVKKSIVKKLHPVEIKANKKRTAEIKEHNQKSNDCLQSLNLFKEYNQSIIQKNTANTKAIDSIVLEQNELASVEELESLNYVKNILKDEIKTITTIEELESLNYVKDILNYDLKTITTIEELSKFTKLFKQGHKDVLEIIKSNNSYRKILGVDVKGLSAREILGLDEIER